MTIEQEVRAGVGHSSRRFAVIGKIALGISIAALGGSFALAEGRDQDAASPQATSPRKQPASDGLLPIEGYILPDTPYRFAQRMEFPNTNGVLATGYTGEPFNTATHPFFKAGSNGRACVTCHQPENAMSISVDTIRKRWDETAGRDPLFDVSDGANCPNLPRDKRESHSLLLDHGLFRMGLPWPPKRTDGSRVEPEFTIEVISDPTGCNTSADYGLDAGVVSVFRRPRPAANMRYLLAGRTTFNVKTMSPLERDPVTGAHSPMSIMSDARMPSLTMQATDASGRHMGLNGDQTGSVHSGLRRLNPDELQQIVDFELKLHAAQNASKYAGRFDVAGTPKALGIDAMVNGQAGVNGNDRDSGVFFFFDEWKPKPGKAQGEADAFRASVARGYDLFFLEPFWIKDVAGLTTILASPYKQTCAFCHATQLIGGDQNPGWMDIGTNTFPHATNAMGRALPTFKVTCKASAPPHPYEGRVIYTHDPGRALTSGLCADVGGLVMQQFRGLSARAPYFNNGSAANLREVIDFYDRRFDIGYSERDKQDLVNFLSVL